MGVPIGEADDDTKVRLECQDCEEEFETDHTMNNWCPHCGSSWWDVA